VADTTHLVLPYIEAAQAQKHVTHNEALRTLDSVVQLAVLDTDLAAPPASPVEGARYIVATSASGAWAGQAGRIAAWQDGAWAFHVPREGWLAWVADEDKLYVHDGAAWVLFAGGASVNPAPLVGVNTTADATNRLAVKSDAALFSHDDVTPGSGDMRAKINKSAAARTASLLFQDGFSGRAEVGLTGDDDFHFKVSADGATFKEAIVLDRATGKASFPQMRVLEEHAVNLLQDSGRMCDAGSWISAQVTSFVAPGYFALINASTLTSHAKFIFNNSTYGGSGAALDSFVSDLIAKIRVAGNGGPRCYNVEFYVAKLTKGAGTAGANVAGGVTRYEALYSRQSPRLANASMHCYLRAKTGTFHVRNTGGATMFLDGVSQGFGNPAIIAPADGWKAVLIQDTLDPFNSYGYSPALFDIYQAATNDEVLIACPALLGGITQVDKNIGVVPAQNVWTV